LSFYPLSTGWAPPVFFLLARGDGRGRVFFYFMYFFLFFGLFMFDFYLLFSTALLLFLGVFSCPPWLFLFFSLTTESNFFFRGLPHSGLSPLPLVLTVILKWHSWEGLFLFFFFPMALDALCPLSLLSSSPGFCPSFKPAPFSVYPSLISLARNSPFFSPPWN